MRDGEELRHVRPAESVAVSTLRLVEGSGRPLLFVAGGTGWSTIKALVEDYAARSPERSATLLVAARDGDDVYDTAGIEDLLDRCPFLRAWAVLPGSGGTHRRIGEELLLALRHYHPGPDAEAYLSGPPGMVATARAWLRREGGLPDERIRFDVRPEEPAGRRAAAPED